MSGRNAPRSPGREPGRTGPGGAAGAGRADAAGVYADLRPLMFSIAYRMLGSVTEAEDIVQEAFLRYHRVVAENGPPDSPKAYLSAVTTRLCIDQLRSARARRLSYVGDWLPEPLLTGPAPLTEPAPDPAALAEQADSLSMAFLLLLERLSPVERAVFLLHDVFSYDYAETADIVGRSVSRPEASSRTGPGSTSRRTSRGSRPRPSAGTSWRRGSSARSGVVTWTAWSASSPKTSSCPATTPGCRPRGCGRSSVAATSAGCSPRSVSNCRRRARPWTRCRSTASQVRWRARPTAA